jgi:hypothetical protein
MKAIILFQIIEIFSPYNDRLDKLLVVKQRPFAFILYDFEHSHSLQHFFLKKKSFEHV